MKWELRGWRSEKVNRTNRVTKIASPGWVVLLLCCFTAAFREGAARAVQLHLAQTRHLVAWLEASFKQLRESRWKRVRYCGDACTTVAQKGQVADMKWSSFGV